MIQKLKNQLKETHEELDQSKQELQSKEEQVQAVRQEVSRVWVFADLYSILISFIPKLSTERINQNQIYMYMYINCICTNLEWKNRIYIDVI